jgi:hypothetical protein
MDEVSTGKAQFLEDALEEIQEADSKFPEMAECRACVDGMTHASKAGDEALFNKIRDELGAFVQPHQEKASPSSTETCCVCDLPAIEGSMLRCTNSDHTNAVFHFTCLNEEMPEMPPGEPTALCPGCQSKDHDADDGARIASDSPRATDRENDEVPCDQCSRTSNDSATLANHSKEAPDASSNPPITEILRALQDSQQKLLANSSAQQQSQTVLVKVVSAMQQGQQELQQGLQQLLDNASVMQQGQDDLQNMASATQEGQHELQQHVSKMQEGQQKAVHQHPVTQRGQHELQTKQLEMKADVQQIQRQLQQKHLEMKTCVQRMQEQQDTNVKRLELTLLRQQRERKEQVFEEVKERANDMKRAEERLRERIGALEVKCQPSEREIKLLEELEDL